MSITRRRARRLNRSCLVSAPHAAAPAARHRTLFPQYPIELLLSRTVAGRGGVDPMSSPGSNQHSGALRRRSAGVR